MERREDRRRQREGKEIDLCVLTSSELRVRPNPRQFSTLDQICPFLYQVDTSPLVHTNPNLSRHALTDVSTVGPLQ